MCALGGEWVVWVMGGTRRQERVGNVFRIRVLAFALGAYLPIRLSAAILAGGLVAGLVKRKEKAHPGLESQAGLLCAAGLVTGEALMGIALAVPIALSGLWPSVSPDPLMIFDIPPWGGWPGLAVWGAVGVWLYLRAVRQP